MKKHFLRYIDKLFFKKWTIGIGYGNIENIIRNKTFDVEINWIDLKTNKRFVADPFFVPEKQGENLKVLVEDFVSAERYGKISLFELSKDFKVLKSNTLLDTSSHLSYPFLFQENGRTFIFPESGNQGKLSCYEYSAETKTLTFVKNIVNVPLFDSTIFRYNNKFWLFGILSFDEGPNYELNVYFADSLLGNYRPHPKNPIKSGLNGIRPAGNFIIVDDEIYRPTQNCENGYGESIAINKITRLDETEVTEELYMTISPDSKISNNKKLSKIHTINTLNNTIVVDGMISVFAPWLQLKNSVKFRIQKRRENK